MFSCLPRALVCVPLFAVALGACKRSPGTSRTQRAGNVQPPSRDVLCVEQPEGCVYCTGRDAVVPQFLDSDQSRPLVCNPKDEEDCVEFCSILTPDCALPWLAKTRCVFESELDFQRAVFNRDTSDRPEVQVTGRLLDEGGKRVEGAQVSVWVSQGIQLTALAQESTGKDGTFRLRLRTGPWDYALRFSRQGLANVITERLLAEKLAASWGNQIRTFRMGPASVLKGRVLDNSGTMTPIANADVTALRALEDGIESSTARTGADGSFVLGGLESRRYFLRVSKFGWRPAVTKGIQAGSGSRVTIKLLPATVIRGVVRDKDGEPEPDATVAAVLSDAPGVPTTPIFWSTDGDGAFAQDRFAPGTYYLWARKADMLAYPPEKIEVAEGATVEVSLSLQVKGARVKGQVLPEAGYRVSPEARVVLISRSSPLAFPRPAVADLRDPNGHFELSGMLPGSYEINIRQDNGILAIAAGPREIEIPIDADGTILLKEAIKVRARIGE